VANARRLLSLLSTALGRPRGFFLPYRYAAGIEPPRTPYATLENLFREASASMAVWLAAGERHAASLTAIADDAPAPEPRWRQDWFPRLDAAMAYTIVRERAPKRIVEIGSGHSTRFMSRAVADATMVTNVACIDPAPRASLSGLPVALHRRTLQDGDDELVAALAPGDVLFVDSSHLLIPGSDVDIVLNRLVPALPRGALLHFHDIFLPDPYPREWAWRAYNEQSALAPLLIGGRFKILWSSHYVRTRLAARLDGSPLGRLTLAPGALESSLWLERT